MNSRPDASEPGPVPGLQELARERLPQRDLWPGIESRLAPRRRRSTPWVYGLAASVCIATVAGLLLRRPEATPAAAEPVLVASAAGETANGGGWSQPPETDTARLPKPMRTVRSESWDDLPEAGGDEGLVSVGYRPYARGAARPVRSGGHQRTLMRANLKLISQAERELRRALREDPESESLRDLLSAAQSQRQSLQGLISDDTD
jgi:hypothetical protein